MTDNEIIVGSSVFTGSKWAKMSEKHTMVYTIPGFEKLPDHQYKTSIIRCHGYRWFLKFYPKGNDEAKRTGGSGSFYSLFLYCADVTDGVSVTARFAIRLQMNGHQKSTEIRTYSKNATNYGFHQLCSRDKVLRACNANNGSLVIKVDLEVEVQGIGKPKSVLKDNLLGLYDSKKATDVTFLIGDCRLEAHRAVMLAHKSHLASLLEDILEDHVEMPMDGEDPELFEALIRFHYTETLPSGLENSTKAIPLLKLADKYDCQDLKILLENHIATSPTIITATSAIEILLFADSHNCTALRSATMSFLMDNLPEIMELRDWEKVLDSPTLLRQVMRELSKVEMSRVAAKPTAEKDHQSTPTPPPTPVPPCTPQQGSLLETSQGRTKPRTNWTRLAWRPKKK